MGYIWVPIGVGLLAVIFAAYLAGYVLRKDIGTLAMQKIADAIHEGAVAFLIVSSERGCAMTEEPAVPAANEPMIGNTFDSTCSGQSKRKSPRVFCSIGQGRAFE